MAGTIDAKLHELGITLATPMPPIATYVPFALSGTLLVVSGQLPTVDGQVAVAGKLGATVDLEDGARGARLSFLNVLAHARAACGGDLDRIRRVVRLGGFVACTPDFTRHAQVMNGASDLAVAIFGDAGRHARTTIGVASLPLDAAVEVEAIFEVSAPV